VATGHETLAAEMTDLDVAPLAEGLGQLLIGLDIGGGEVVEGLL
jgi:hypothetical protein